MSVDFNFFFILIEAADPNSRLQIEQRLQQIELQQKLAANNLQLSCK